VEEQPQVERDIALDLVKHGLLLAPAVIVVAGLVSGWEGAASAAIAFAIVLLNFLPIGYFVETSHTFQ